MCATQGLYFVEHYVVDSYGLTSESDYEEISVVEPNQAPSVDGCATDLSAQLLHDGIPNAGTVVVPLDGTCASDPDLVDVLSYQWLSGSRDNDGLGGLIQYVELGTGQHDYTLIVTDPYGALQR